MGRSSARHLTTYAHLCPMTGRRVGLDRAIRWSPVSKRPARHRPPVCPVCGQPMTLERLSYQTVLDDDWDDQLERTRIILSDLLERSTH